MPQLPELGIVIGAIPEAGECELCADDHSGTSTGDFGLSLEPAEGKIEIVKGGQGGIHVEVRFSGDVAPRDDGLVVMHAENVQPCEDGELVGRFGPSKISVTPGEGGFTSPAVSVVFVDTDPGAFALGECCVAVEVTVGDLTARVGRRLTCVDEL